MANYNNETGSIADLDGKTFALTFTSKLNETFTTIPIVFASTASGTGDVDMRNDVQLALLSLPNKVIDGVTVSLSEVNTGVQNPQGSYGTTEFNTMYRDIDDFNVLEMQVTFTGSAVQGRQNFLTVEDYECHDGCTPKLTGLNLQYKYDHFNSNITNVGTLTPLTISLTSTLMSVVAVESVTTTRACANALLVISETIATPSPRLFKTNL